MPNGIALAAARKAVQLEMMNGIKLADDAKSDLITKEHTLATKTKPILFAWHTGCTTISSFYVSAIKRKRIVRFSRRTAHTLDATFRASFRRRGILR